MSVMNICKLEESTWFSKDISLRQSCRELTKNDLMSEWIRPLLSDLFETLYSTPSGIGLAAPQVGVQLKIVVIDIKRDAKKPLVLINPSFINVDDTIEESVESCLSVPGVVGKVSRFSKIKLNYTDLQGDIVEDELDGFLAIAVQHEIDHINGVVYVDKLLEGETVQATDSHIHRMSLKATDTLYKNHERVDL